MRANEKFSGRGHARHLCKDCARLGKEELAYRQAIRNLERLVTWEGIIPRKKRAEFCKYLEHENERVRAYAIELQVADTEARAELRREQEMDEPAGGPPEEDETRRTSGPANQMTATCGASLKAKKRRPPW